MSSSPREEPDPPASSRIYPNTWRVPEITAEAKGSTGGIVRKHEPFHYRAWHFFFHDRKVRPYGPNLMNCSIAEIKQNTFEKNNKKVQVAVRIKSSGLVDMNRDVVFEDGTGTMKGIIHWRAYIKDAIDVAQGNVLVLKNVFGVLDLENSGDSHPRRWSDNAPLAPVKRKSTFNPGSKVSMMVHADNIVATYNKKDCPRFVFKKIDPLPYASTVVMREKPTSRMLKRAREEKEQ